MVNKMRLLFTLLFCLISAWALKAQPPCPDTSYVSVVVTIKTDGYGYEIGWNITGSSGTVYHQVPFNTYANGSTFQQQVCVPPSECITFNIFDSYGDGIFAPGFYRVEVEGELIAQGGDFNDYEFVNFNCQPGQVCNSAIPIVEGIYTTSFDNHWYIFEPDSIGTYLITTCGFTDCNTTIWVYETCQGNGLTDDNQGIVFYDDDDSDCAPQAQVEAYMDPAKTYYIRIGDHADSCHDTITWSITYLGPVAGCTQIGSCNYNPLATVDDGSCLPQGDPACPEAPDLELDENVLRNSMYLTTIQSTDPCLIQEGCLKGYGLRDIIRFSTKISNIGEKDYYIGPPNAGNTQFTYDNCHNHFHYAGYAEYLLFDENGVVLPAGFKNGFCVLDLGCTTGSGQYGCGNMGISAGCYDEYWSALECQWIDVTDVPDGRYVLVTRVNWDNDPDALGQVEKDTLNNWGQVCIILDRSSGELEMEMDDDCPPVVDCNGTPYGNVREDCNGVCGGAALRGDLDLDGVQEISDAVTYVDGIMADDLEATPCNDLNADGEITVYDAALLTSCLNFGTAHLHIGQGIHDHCNFPAGIVNQVDTVTFSIIDVNFDEQYFDIGITNPTDYVHAYQFRVSGITPMNIENLVDPVQYPITPRINIDGGMVVGISYEDSLILKSPDMQPLCRIYFTELTGDYICIDEIIEVVNEDHEQVSSKIVDGCVVAVGVTDVNPAIPVTIQPNPMTGVSLLRFPNPAGNAYHLELMDAKGQVVRVYNDITDDQVRIERQSLPAGMYFYRLHGEAGFATGRFAVQ